LVKSSNFTPGESVNKKTQISVSLLMTLGLVFGLQQSANATVKTTKPSTFCFDAFKVVKTSKYGKLKCLAYRTPRGMVWIWTRV
jgi:hypothetical protein